MTGLRPSRARPTLIKVAPRRTPNRVAGLGLDPRGAKPCSEPAVLLLVGGLSCRLRCFGWKAGFVIAAFLAGVIVATMMTEITSFRALLANRAPMSFAHPDPERNAGSAHERREEAAERDVGDGIDISCDRDKKHA